MKITKRQLRRIIREVHPRAVADNAIFDYEEWVESAGHLTPSASSVMASYILAQGIEDEHEIHQILADQFSLNHNDVMRELATQQQERRIAMGESRNGISRRQLRKIIQETVEYVGEEDIGFAMDELEYEGITFPTVADIAGYLRASQSAVRQAWSRHSDIFGQPEDGPDASAVDLTAEPAEEGRRRSIYEIAAEIKRAWSNVHYAARPYLDAMHNLESIDQAYGADSGEDIVIRFLSNASQWKGAEAKRIKAELKQMISY